MQEYFEYIVTWLFFMALIAVICLLVPKIAPKIRGLFGVKPGWKNPYDLGDDSPPEPSEENTEEN